MPAGMRFSCRAHLSSAHAKQTDRITARGRQGPVRARDEDGKLVRDDDGKPVMRAKYTGFHAPRHSFASWCNGKIDGGLELPPKVVQEPQGHSSITVTMDIYGHPFPRGDDSAERTEAASRLWG